jgi:hypothetical protein
MASYYKLTLNATFPERVSHGISRGPDFPHLVSFFHGDVFHARFHNVTCKETFNIPVTSMAATVVKAKQLCQTGVICLSVNHDVAVSEALIDVASYRSNFAVPPDIAQAVNDLPYFDEKYLRVAVHIRRGDVVNRTKDAYNRWVFNSAYLDFIPKLLARVKTRLPISLVLFAEGANSTTHVPDVLPNIFHDFSLLHENVSLGPTDVHLALGALCSADLLVTSSSGYSHLAALLCKKPRVLAVPFWQSYVSLPNFLTELTIQRDATDGINQLDLPGSFRYECNR